MHNSFLKMGKVSSVDMSGWQVSVYGRSRLGQDVFLGEVLIPLREVEETGASGIAEVHKFILGRRSTKERVSGEIALACSWRVTPLDVVIMKVSPTHTASTLQNMSLCVCACLRKSNEPRDHEGEVHFCTDSNTSVGKLRHSSICLASETIGLIAFLSWAVL